MTRLTAPLTLAAATMMVAAAQAADLTVGIATEPTSIDGNFYNFPQNHAVADHWSETVVALDNTQQATPGLAASWAPVPGDDKVWEFKLRKGVKFQDGTPFTADDVLFTQQYAVTVTTTSPPGRYWKNKTITKVDDYTLRVTTGTSYPLMAKEMAMVHVVSRKNGTGKTSEDYNAGKGTVGTGPYKFVEWVKGDRVVLVANPDYWGLKPIWDKVTFKPISSDPARVAALLSGSVDIIDYVPTSDLAKLRKTNNVAITEFASNRVIYMIPDVGREMSPFVRGADGQPLKPNPLLDKRVRKALSLAIDRNAIVERVMEGAAIPAGQMSPDFIFGHDPALKPDPHDPGQAKKLLAEAGYPDGFQLTIHGPNDRYVNDDKILETIAQMLTKVGIKTEVVAMPKATYFTRVARGSPEKGPEFTFSMMGSGSNLGDGGSQIENSHHTVNVLPNMGVLNYSLYSNPVLDALLEKEARTVNADERAKLIRQGIGIIMADYAMIPLHFQKNIWAHRADLAYAGHTDEMTKAMLVTRKK